MKLTTGYKKPIASSGTDALELTSNNSYLLLAGGGHKALSELVSPADLTTALSNYVTIGSNQTITGVKTFSLAINADITGNASTATNVNWSGVTNRPTNVSAFNNDVGYVTTDTTYSTATSDTLGLVKIGYTANGKNYPVQLSNGQMYVNVLWTDTWRPITDSYSGTSSDTSLSQKGGKAIYDALVNGYATNAGNAGTLNGYTSDDFVLKTTHDVYESVIAEALNDLDSRKADIADIPTSLPANGGNADTSDYAAYLRGRDGNGVYFGKETSSNIIAEWNTKSDNRWYLKAASTNQCRVEYADKVDWIGIDNKPSYFTPSSHTHTTSEITNFPTIGNGALHIKVNGTELTPEGGLFTANKSDNSTINIPMPTAESIELSTLNKLGDKVVFKNTFANELAKEMAEVMSEKNTKEKLVFKFANPDPGRSLECNPDILSVNYIKVGEYYRLNISGSFVLNGFNFYEQKLQDNYNPVLYLVSSGTINNVELFAEKTGMLYFRLSDQQTSENGAYGPVMFELSVFVKSLSTDYNNGIYGELNITQFYS